ncbi:MAG TPA: signal recognition particle-docking protein FtsY [Candidatus Azoamicus sp. MARI]
MFFFDLFKSSNSLEEKKNIISKIKNIFSTNSKVSNYIESLSDVLIESDVGVDTTDKIINKLKLNTDISNKVVKQNLFNILHEILEPCEVKFDLNNNFSKPIIILVCGLNGVGKTTSVVKIANIYKNLGKKVCVIAGDTYRVAAIEQLTLLCDKNFIPVIKQHYKADSSSVIYDALIYSIKKDFDVVIIDTSGRLHTNNILMSDLLKIKTTIKKIDSTAPHEVLMVIDTNVGQNSIAQVSKFHDMIGVSGLCLTKFDGSSKCGVIFNLAVNFKIPLRYICFGEKINDIDFFNSIKFLNKLL